MKHPVRIKLRKPNSLSITPSNYMSSKNKILNRCVRVHFQHMCTSWHIQSDINVKH